MAQESITNVLDARALDALCKMEQAKYRLQHPRTFMSSRNLLDLTDEMQSHASAHLSVCARAGIDLLIYCTLRSNEEQTALYAEGRTAPGHIVTNAQAGESAHNPNADGRSMAYDCVPLRGGKPVWGNTSDPDRELWEKIGTLGESVGLIWAGRWTGKLREMAHFQSPLFKKEA